MTVGKGWFCGLLGWEGGWDRYTDSTALIASLCVTYQDGSTEELNTDTSWEVAKSEILFSELYDGETVDARIVPSDFKQAMIYDYAKENLIPQEGETVEPPVTRTSLMK